MQKHLLFIESNTTGTGMLAVYKARELALHPLFLTHDPTRYHGLQTAGCPIYLCDTNTFNTLQRVIEQEIGVDKVLGILTTSEFYLETVARLTELYGLAGNSPTSIALCRNKAETRQCLRAADVAQPRFSMVGSLKDLAGALGEIGLPCVVKPVDDSGSNEVRLCITVHEAEEQIARILNIVTNARGQPTVRTALVEAFLDAPEYSVEMFSWSGGTTCIGITEKIVTGFPYFVECQHVFPAMLPPFIADEMIYTVRRALQAVGITAGATHTEVKLTSEGTKVIEINGRLAGGMIPELIRNVTGIDLLEQQIHMAVNKRSHLPLKYEGYAGIRFLLAQTAGKLKKIRGLEAARAVPGVQQIALHVAEGASVVSPRCASDRLGFIIAHTADHEGTIHALARAADHLQVVISSTSPEEVYS